MSLVSKEKKTINLTENLYQREKWIAKLALTAKKGLSNENYDLFKEYNNEMIRLSHSKISRHKNLTHYVKLSLIYNKDWKNISEKDVKNIVGIIMEKHSDNSQESNYTFDLKKSLRAIVKFAFTDTRKISKDGELKILRCVKAHTNKLKELVEFYGFYFKT